LTNAPRRRVFLGGLHPIKGIDVLLHAWKIVRANGFADWELRLVGPDELDYRASLERLVASERIPSVHFAGPAYDHQKWPGQYSGNCYGGNRHIRPAGWLLIRKSIENARSQAPENPHPSYEASLSVILKKMPAAAPPWPLIVFLPSP
jgi:glycosyltransferase involved in cell wall biosynthesis